MKKAISMKKQWEELESEQIKEETSEQPENYVQWTHKEIEPYCLDLEEDDFDLQLDDEGDPLKEEIDANDEDYDEHLQDVLQEENSRTHANGLFHFMEVKNQENEGLAILNSVLQKQDKARICQKIQEILARRKPAPSLAASSQSPPAMSYSKPRKRRTVINAQMIEKLQRIFEEYNLSINRPNTQRLTFRNIGQHLSISMAEIKYLYDEYTKDPLFMCRKNRLKLASGELPSYSHDITMRRLEFIKGLINRYGNLSYSEIASRMEAVEDLHVVTKKGVRLPISKKAVQHIMRVGNIQPRQQQTPLKDINTPECIQMRFNYASRYLQLVEDRNAEICFMGEFSFVNGLSFSSCAPLRRDGFCPARSGKVPVSQLEMGDRWVKKPQYMLVISPSGVMHFELYNNIFSELKFHKTLALVGKSINTRNPALKKKYLVVETCFLHKKDDLKEFERTYEIKVIFLPPQAPMLNPTEYLFNDLRQMIKSKAYKSRKTVATVLMETIDAMYKKDLSNFYSCTRPYLELALRHQPYK